VFNDAEGVGQSEHAAVGKLLATDSGVISAVPGLLENLEGRTGLITEQIKWRDEMITQQQQQMHKLGEEVIRGEAQLGLLKDLPINQDENER
jgi:hypothetical protein